MLEPTFPLRQGRSAKMASESRRHGRLELEELLVPVDFSASSRVVLAQALEMANGDAPVVVVQHVVDPALASAIATEGYGDEEAILTRMRGRAQEELAAIQQAAGGSVDLQVILSEGTPFYEIVRVAHELAVDAVIIGKSGFRQVSVWSWQVNLSHRIREALPVRTTRCAVLWSAPPRGTIGLYQTS